MSYSTDPIKDAYRHTAQVDAESKELELLTRDYSNIIRCVLTKDIRRAHHAVLSLPCISAIGLDDRVRQMPLAEAVEMEVSSPLVLQALMRVLAESDCPHVNALRNALADSYAEANADLCARAAL